MTTDTKKAAAKMLTAEEEKDLFARAKAGDMKARDKVILAHIPLAAKLAQRASGGSKGRFRDLLSTAQLEIVKAFDAFDPDRGIRFSTFAMTRIPHALSRDWRGVGQRGMSSHSNKLLPLVARARRMAADAAWVPGLPVPAELQQRMQDKFGLDATGVDDLLVAAMPAFSSVHDYEDTMTGNSVEDDGDACSEGNRALLHRLIGEMDARTADILRTRLADDPPPLRVLAERWGISVERVRQIEASAISVITERMRASVTEAMAA